MRQFLATQLVFCVVIPASAASLSEWNQAMRSSTLTAAENALSHYYFIDRVHKMRAVIEANRTRLDQIQQPDAFANAVTKVLYSVARDKHIEVDYSSDMLPNFGKMSAADVANIQRGDRYTIMASTLRYAFMGTSAISGSTIFQKALNPLMMLQ
jgi:hypothetical protein